MPRNYAKENAWAQKKYTIVKLKFHKGDKLLNDVKEDAKNHEVGVSTRVKDILKKWFDSNDPET